VWGAYSGEFVLPSSSAYNNGAWFTEGRMVPLRASHGSSTSIPYIWFTMGFDVHVTVHHDKFLRVKPTRCINYSHLFLEWNSTCFRQFLCPSSGVFHCMYSNGICHRFADSLRAGLQAVCKPVWHIPLLYVQWKTPDDGQRNCLKHVRVSFQK
jgi:hypothetical protein